MASRDCVLFHDIEEYDLRHGDHIYVWRFATYYNHHGIFDAHENMVIHLTGDKSAGKASVAATSLKVFLEGGQLRLYTYEASTLGWLFKRNGSCTTVSSISPSVTVEIARWFADHPNQFGGYRLFSWNCEFFATMCKTAMFTASDLNDQYYASEDIQEYIKARSYARSEQTKRS